MRLRGTLNGTVVPTEAELVVGNNVTRCNMGNHFGLGFGIVTFYQIKIIHSGLFMEYLKIAIDDFNVSMFDPYKSMSVRSVCFGSNMSILHNPRPLHYYTSRVFIACFFADKWLCYDTSVWSGNMTVDICPFTYFCWYILWCCLVSGLLLFDWLFLFLSIIL